MSDEKLDEAVEWHVRLDSDEAGEAAWLAFTAWLEADPANRAAFERVEDAADNFPGRPARAAEVIPFRPRPAPPPPRRWWLRAAAVAAAVAVVGVYFYHPATETAAAVRYTTKIGETRTVELADGSTMTLNTATALSAAVSRTSRHVVLEHGEALFHVAKDSAHPFTVAAGDRTVTVVGTLFDVAREKGRVSVLVAQGMVSVAQTGRTGSQVLLAPGQRADAREGSPAETVAPVDTDRALSWRQGYLVFEDAPLGQVLKDLDRYFPTQVTIGDAAAGQERFSGVLRIDNEDAMLERLTRFLPVRVERAQGGITLVDARKRD
ncbi:MAG TPA: FecR domain-containing protein [Rhizomicrobium sp.]|nr:FecR domain-containing protein [Rhizomicrobium sp.]